MSARREKLETVLESLIRTAEELDEIEELRMVTLNCRRIFAHEARDAGHPVIEIAAALQVSRQTVHKLLSDW